MKAFTVKTLRSLAAVLAAALAATLDQLTYRTSPKRLRAKGQDAVVRWLQTPAGMAAAGAVGLLVTLVVVQRVRHRND